MRHLLLALAAWLPLPVVAYPAVDQSPWALASLGLFKDAHDAFARDTGGGRFARLGEAATLLNIQPRTTANINRAAAMLERVVEEEGGDAIGITARYLRARISHIHRKAPDPVDAAARYRELAALGPVHSLTQRALVQLALIELFEPGVPVAELRGRHDRLAALGRGLVDASARRDFYLVMGDAALRLGFDDVVAMEHLIEADRAGISRTGTLRDNWLRIAGLAERAGRSDVAVAHYERFLAAALRDTRRLAVEQRLASFRDQ